MWLFVQNLIITYQNIDINLKLVYNKNIRKEVVCINIQGGVVVVDKCGYIDLHVHSNASDGLEPVGVVMKKAIKNKVSVISFTEHYNLGSYQEAYRIEKQTGKIEVIPGIEISASVKELPGTKKRTCHILAYYPSYRICNILDEYEVSREKCLKKTIKKLQTTGVKISYDIVKKYARSRNSIGRYDVAIALKKLGYAKTTMSAYGQFLDVGMRAYVERDKPTTKELLSKIRSVGGVPVLAHPRSLHMGRESLEKYVTRLREEGLEGIELYNPSCSFEVFENIRYIADKLNLVTTVGSDYHGKESRNIYVGLGINGNLRISKYEIIEELKTRQNQILLHG